MFKWLKAAASIARKDSRLNYSGSDYLRAIVPVIGFAICLSAILYLSYLYPPSGDIWYVLVDFRMVDTGLKDHINAYFWHYVSGNPRIGMIAYHIAGESRLLQSLVCAAIYLLLTSSSYLLLRRSITLNFFEYSTIFTGILILLGIHIGKGLVYFPNATQYALGISLVFFYASILASALSIGNAGARHWLGLFLIAPFAGLSNEHTIPAILAVTAVFYVYLVHLQKVQLSKSLKRFFAAWWLLLFSAYLFLFFAPGQSVRHGGIKGRGIQELDERLFAKAGSIIEIVLNTWYVLPIILLIIASALIPIVSSGKTAYRLAASNSTGSGDTHRMYSSFFTVFLVSVGLGCAAIMIFAPFFAHRMFFATFSLISMAGVIQISSYLGTNRSFVTLSTITSTIICIVFWMSGFNFISPWRTAFDQHIDALVEAEQLNLDSPIVLEPYSFDFDPVIAFEFGHNEIFSADPSASHNQTRSKFYSVGPVSFQAEKDDYPWDRYWFRLWQP